MSPAARQALADKLIAARREGVQVRALPADECPADAAEGYAINALVAEGLGWPTFGWKIAATTPEMQRRLRATEPIYGRTFRRFAVHSPAQFHHAELLDPLVECEFFFELASDLAPRSEPYTSDEVADAVRGVFAGIEVAECRFPLAALPAMPAILADGAASGRYVIGDAMPDWRSRDLASMTVRLEVNGRPRRSGAGHDVMGHPLEPLVWLANARRLWGDGLKAGDMISTGTATGMLLAAADDRVRATFGDAFTVAIDFDL